MLNQVVRSLIGAGEKYRVTPAGLLDETLPDYGDTRAKTSGFWVLLIASSIIAAAGVITDSTAVVIGAMVIAPLGTPIYGIAAALVAGMHTGPAILRVVTGVLAAIAIGALADAMTLERIALDSNPQILSRINPSMVDLGVAFATGFAGSMALVRTDISPALPGVAIAISLVPPLSVVGITLAHGEWSMATGAFMLFGTNMLAIILAGLVVFKGAGIDQPFGDKIAKAPHARVTLIAGTIIVVGFLAAGSLHSLTLYADEQKIRNAASDWADEQDDWQLESVERSGEHVRISFLGSGDPPIESAENRESELAELAGSGIDLIIEFEQGGRTTL